MSSTYLGDQVFIDKLNGTKYTETVDVYIRNMDTNTAITHITTDANGFFPGGTLSVVVGTNIRFRFLMSTDECGYYEKVTL